MRQTRSGRVVNGAVDLSCKIVSIGGFGYARKLYADCIKLLPHKEGIRRYNFHLQNIISASGMKEIAERHKRKKFGN